MLIILKPSVNREEGVVLEIFCERPGKVMKGALFHQDNAPTHKSVVAMAAVCDCGFEQVDHPPYYSLDFAPSDNFLCPNIKTKSLSWWNRTPFFSFPGGSRNVSSTTFQSPELLIQCGSIWKETMQLVSGKVEYNTYQVSLLWHNSSVVCLWTFQPSLVWLLNHLGRGKSRHLKLAMPPRIAVGVPNNTFSPKNIHLWDHKYYASKNKTKKCVY